MKVRVNKKSLSVKVQALKDQLVTEPKTRLESIAFDLSVRSPVQSGAYAESFSVRPASDGGGRSRSSFGKPRNQDVATYQDIAFRNMVSDIALLNFEDIKTGSVSFRNRAPHAGYVENKYQVFGQAKDINRG